MQKLIIKNFRQIPYAEIDITKFTIFIGPQASGKSTIAKLIYFFKMLKYEFKSLPASELESKEDYLQTFKDMIEDNFYKSFGAFEASDSCIKFYFDDIRFVEIKAGEHLNPNCALEDGFKEQAVDILAKLFDHYNHYDLQTTELKKELQTELIKQLTNRYNSFASTVSSKLFRDSKEVVFFPASRNILVSMSSLFQKFFWENKEEAFPDQNPTFDNQILARFLDYVEFLKSRMLRFGFTTIGITSEDTDIKKTIGEKTERILRAKYRQTKDAEFILNEGKSTPLYVASTGQQESIRILQDLFDTTTNLKPVFRLIEEPEAHLFPEAQKHLIELMTLMANKTDSQVVITTHSPYILSVVNNLLFYSQTINRNPDANDAIKRHFGVENLDESKNERIYLTSDEVRVYSLGNNKSGNYFESIIDLESGLIGANFLDEVAESMYQDFDFLYPLNRKEAEA